MKFALVLEAVDKASKAIKAVSAAQKAAGRTAVETADNAARATERAMRAQEANSRAMKAANTLSDKHNKSLTARIAALGKLNGLTAKLGKIQAAIRANGGDEIKAGYATAQAGLRGMMARALKISAVGAAGGASFSALFMKPAAQYSQLKKQLTDVMGSADGAAKALKWVQGVQAPPHGVMELTAGFVALRTAGLDPTKGALMAVANAAIKQSKSLEEVMAAMQASFAGDYDGLNELGIAAQRQGKYIAYTFRDTDGVMKRIRAAAGDTGAQAAAMAEIMRRTSGDAAKEYGQTWDGMMARLSDTFDRVRLKLMDAGLYKFINEKIVWVQSQLDKFMVRLEGWAQDGTLDQWIKGLTVNLERGLNLAWAVGLKFYHGALAVYWVLDKFSYVTGGWASILTVLIALPFVPFLLRIVRGLGQMAGGIVKIMKFFGIGKLLGKLKGPMVSLFGYLGKALPWVGRGLMLASRAFISLGISMMTTPIGWIIMGIAAIAGGAYLIYKNWDKIGPYFTVLWEWVKGVFTGFWEWFKGFLTPANIGNAVLLAFAPIIGLPVLVMRNWDKISPYFTMLWDGLQNIASAAWEAIKEAIGWDSFAPALTDFGSKLAGKFTEIWGAVKQGASEAWDWLTATFSWENAKAAFDSLKAGIIGIFKGIWDYVGGVLGKVSAAWDKIKGWFGGASAAEASASADKAVSAANAGQMPAAEAQPRSQGTAANAGGAGDVVLNFAPVISINGAEPSAVQKAMADMYERFRRELPKMMDEAARRKERLAY